MHEGSGTSFCLMHQRAKFPHQLLLKVNVEAVDISHMLYIVDEIHYVLILRNSHLIGGASTVMEARTIKNLH